MLLNADVMAQETSTFESNIKLSYSLFEEEGKRTTTKILTICIPDLRWGVWALARILTVAVL